MNTLKAWTLFFILFGLLLEANADNQNKIATQYALSQKVDNNLIFNIHQRRPEITQLKPHVNQAATDETEDGEPTGPDVSAPPIHLADIYEEKSRYIIDDFDNQIAYNEKLIRDNSSLNTYYFYPNAYFLKYDSQHGYALDFLHRTREEDSAEDLIVMTFTISPRLNNGGFSLIKRLAENAVTPANNKKVDLKRLPISSVKVMMQSLTSFIAEEKLRVINSPQDVGDEIRVQATMTQSEKEDVVASIRSGGLSGDLIFTTNGEKFEIIIPYYVNFTDYSGEWVTDITKMKTTESLSNMSPFPLLFKGIVAYTEKNNHVSRHFVPLNSPIVLPPGARATADKAYNTLLANKGKVLSTWAAYDKVACDVCLNTIEQEVLVAPSVASRAELAIEAIPNIFSEFSLFKVLIEIRSKKFSSSGDFEEIKTVTLREDSTQEILTLYIDRDKGSEENFEYRITPYHSDGEDTKKSSWQKGSDALDITISKRDIEPLMATDN